MSLGTETKGKRRRYTETYGKNRPPVRLALLLELDPVHSIVPEGHVIGYSCPLFMSWM